MTQMGREPVGAFAAVCGGGERERSGAAARATAVRSGGGLEKAAGNP